MKNADQASGRLTVGASRAAAARRAFTLIELLVVIGIIGILAVISVPAVKGLTQANTVAAAHRQLMDDLGLARRLAISGRRTVYVLFVPPTAPSHISSLLRNSSRVPPQSLRQQLQIMTNLVNGQFSTYALFARGAAGDQPGRPSARYLTEWRRLPDGVFIDTNKFAWWATDRWRSWTNLTPPRPFPQAELPFPTGNAAPLRLPFLAFDPQGQLVFDKQPVPLLPDELIPLKRGSIFHLRDQAGNYLRPDIVETARTNTTVRVHWLTGRTRVEGMEGAR